MATRPQPLREESEQRSRPMTDDDVKGRPLRPATSRGEGTSRDEAPGPSSVQNNMGEDEPEDAGRGRTGPTL